MTTLFKPPPTFNADCVVSGISAEHVVRCLTSNGRCQDTLYQAVIDNDSVMFRRGIKRAWAGCDNVSNMGLLLADIYDIGDTDLNGILTEDLLRLLMEVMRWLYLNVDVQRASP